MFGGSASRLAKVGQVTRARLADLVLSGRGPGLGEARKHPGSSARFQLPRGEPTPEVGCAGLTSPRGTATAMHAYRLL